MIADDVRDIGESFFVGIGVHNLYNKVVDCPSFAQRGATGPSNTGEMAGTACALLHLPMGQMQKEDGVNLIPGIAQPGDFSSSHRCNSSPTNY